MLLIVIVVVIVLVFAGDSGKTPKNPTSTSSGVQSTGGAHPPAADVSITSCDVDSATSFPSAKLEIVNHSSKPSEYFIDVEFVDVSGTRVAEGAAILNHVAPGEKAEDTAGGLAPVSGKITCKVTSVDRISVVG
uniref:Secreted protein n=1 Tax=Streptomyces sp. NBC_00003 TaxID=2903608 RepID=A0AAU2UWC3_9ACTN